MGRNLFFEEHTRGLCHMVKEPGGGVVASENFLTVKNQMVLRKLYFRKTVSAVLNVILS